MAMDRTEKLGLGAAVGGHVVLLGAMALGLLISDEPLKKPEAISVSLIGEIAEVSTAPDAIQEESAPPAPAEAEPAEPPPAPVMKVERPVEKQQAKPVPKPLARETPPPSKTAAKKVAVKQPPAKTAAAPAKSGKGTTPAKPGGLSKSFEDSISNIGKAPGAGKAVGTPAAKSAAEVRRSVSVSLASQIRSRVRACAPSGVEINKIETFVTLPAASTRCASTSRLGSTTATNRRLRRSKTAYCRRCALLRPMKGLTLNIMTCGRPTRFGSVPPDKE
jgi:periplasmic protein TonB